METSNLSQPTPVLKRFAGILLNPRQTFEEIVKHPNWGLALFIITLINVVCTLITLPKLKVFMLETLQQEMQTNPALNTPEALHIVETTSLIGAVIGALFIPAITCLVLALLFKLFNAFSGDKQPLRRFFTISVYAYIPVLFTLLIQTIVVSFSAHPDFSAAPSSLYLFFPAGASGFAANLAKQVDIFFLWSLFLAAMGSSILIRKPLRSTTIYIFILWAAYALFIASRTPALT